MLGELDLLAAEVGEADVGDLVVLRGGSRGGHLGPPVGVMLQIQGLVVELGAAAELRRFALLDLLRRQALDALGAELLDVEGRDRRAVGHRAPQRCVVQGVSQVPCHASDEPGEAVARAGRVGDGPDGVGREREEGIGGDECRSVLALLGDDGLRAPAENLARGRDRVRQPRELAKLGVVQDHAVDAADDVDEVVASGVDPEVHRVERHESRRRALVEHVALKSRLDVGEEEDVAGARGLRELRLEGLEHVQPRVERLARVEVPAVLAAPEEGLAARHVLDVVGEGAPRRENGEVLVAEVVADRAHCGHGVEERRRQREVGRRAAEHPLALAERRLDRVERDRSDDRDAHSRSGVRRRARWVISPLRRPWLRPSPPLPQRVGPVGPLPREVRVLAAEVAVGGGLLEDRPVQVEVLAEGAGAQVEVLADDPGQLGVGELAGPERLDHHRDRVGDADRVGDLDLAALGEPGGDDVLGHVAGRVGRRAVDLRGVLAREGAAAVAGHAAVGVDDDLAAGEAAVADRAADHEAAGGVDEEARRVFRSAVS